MKYSLFDVLDQSGLSHLRISTNWRTDKFQVLAAKEWDDDINWADYNKTFTLSSFLTSSYKCFGDNETRELFRHYGQEDYLDSVVELLRKGRHLFLDCFTSKKHHIRFMNNVHNDVLGLNNRCHAIRAGGIRRRDPDEEEYNVIIDGLNLGRGMTFKNFAAKIHYGGTKITVMMDPLDLDNMDVIGFLSYCLDRARTFTGPDMGFPVELADVMKKNFTINITGGPKGPLGATGTPTAYGVYLAGKQASKFLFDSVSLQGKKIAVQGLGAVGYPLAERYISEGASLVVCDIDEQISHDLKKKHPDADIRIVQPDEILYADADIFSPAAIGGIIYKEIIPKLRFKIILGGANNLLKASSREEEYDLSKELQKHGILYQIDWFHNIGGILCGCEEYENQENASMERVLKKVEKICTKQTLENLTTAKQRGITPTENAYKNAENIIYGT